MISYLSEAEEGLQVTAAIESASARLREAGVEPLRLRLSEWDYGTVRGEIQLNREHVAVLQMQLALARAGKAQPHSGEYRKRELPRIRAALDAAAREAIAPPKPAKPPDPLAHLGKFSSELMQAMVAYGRIYGIPQAREFLELRSYERADRGKPPLTSEECVALLNAEIEEHRQYHEQQRAAIAERQRELDQLESKLKSKPLPNL